MSREVEQLRAELDGLRAGVLEKLAGLSDADARRSTVDSGTGDPRWEDSQSPVGDPRGDRGDRRDGR